MEIAMKYVRFQGLEKTDGISSRRGIFQLAYSLKNSALIAEYDDLSLRKNLGWLEMHLNAPSVLRDTKSKRAICWFKDGALEPIKRIRSIQAILTEYDIWIDQTTTSTPGYILYEDGWQIVARPFRR